MSESARQWKTYFLFCWSRPAYSHSFRVCLKKEKMIENSLVICDFSNVSLRQPAVGKGKEEPARVPALISSSSCFISPRQTVPMAMSLKFVDS